jgi:hypothetical protein
MCRFQSGEREGMVTEDLSEETSLLEAERKAYLRKNAMRGLLSVMIAYEDRNRRAMTQDEILATFHYPEVDTERSSIICSTALILHAG